MGVLWEDEAWQEQDKKTLIFKFLTQYLKEILQDTSIPFGILRKP